MEREFTTTRERFLIKAFIISALFLGSLLFSAGLICVLSPHRIFFKFILPVAQFFSNTGRIQEASTVEFLYHEWVLTRFCIVLLGGVLVIVGLIWFCLEREGRNDSPRNNLNIYSHKENILPMEHIVLFSIMFIAAILRFVNIKQSLWSDEVATITGFIRLFRLWRYVELGDHWLYSFLGYLSIKLFGESELSFRLPAFLLGVITVPAIYYCAKDFLSKKESLLACGLITFSAYHIYYSTEGRGYAALALFALLSSSMFLRVIYGKRKISNYFLLGIFTVLGMLSHFYYMWVLFVQFFIIFIVFVTERLILKRINILKGWDGSNILSAITIGVFFAFIIYGPNFIPAIILKYISTYWRYQELSIGRVMGRICTGTPMNVYGSICIILALIGLVDLWRAKRKIMSAYFILLCFLPLIIVRLVFKTLTAFYFIFILPFLILAIAHSMFVLTRRLRPFLRAFALSSLALTFIIFQLPALLTYYSRYKSGHQDYRAAGQLIDRCADKSDMIFAIGVGDLATQYYIKNHTVKYFNEQEILTYLDADRFKFWLIVTFPEYLKVYPQTFKLYESIKPRLKLVGYFPAESEILVYVNKIKK